MLKYRTHTTTTTTTTTKEKKRKEKNKKYKNIKEERNVFRAAHFGWG